MANPPPPVAVRNRLTAVARGIRGDVPLAVVTSSTVFRTVIVGLRLARIVAFPLKGLPSVDAALDWLVRTRPSQRRDHLRARVDEARARVGRPSA